MPRRRAAAPECVDRDLAVRLDATRAGVEALAAALGEIAADMWLAGKLAIDEPEDSGDRGS